MNSLLDADLVVADLTDHNPNVMFEFGMRLREDKPVVVIQAEGTPRIFDVDNVMRAFTYSPNLWPSTVEKDLPALTEWVKAAWDGRETVDSYLKTWRKKS